MDKIGRQLTRKQKKNRKCYTWYLWCILCTHLHVHQYDVILCIFQPIIYPVTIVFTMNFHFDKILSVAKCSSLVSISTKIPSTGKVFQQNDDVPVGLIPGDASKNSRNWYFITSELAHVFLLFFHEWTGIKSSIFISCQHNIHESFSIYKCFETVYSILRA